jgi:hypothetical protein
MFYATRTQAVQHEIINVLGEKAKEHDIEAIANQVIDYGDDARSSGFFNCCEPEEFWDIVDNNHK